MVTHAEELDGSMILFEELVRVEREGITFVLASELLDFWRRKLVVAFESGMPSFERCCNTKPAGSTAGNDHAVMFQMFSRRVADSENSVGECAES